MQSVNYEPLSPLFFLERSAMAYKNEIAVIDKNIIKTYQEFYEDCKCLAKSFKAIGVKQGDRVVYVSRNNYFLLQAHYSLPFIEAILVAVNTRFSEKDIVYILQHSNAKILVIEQDFYHQHYKNFVDMVIILNEQTTQLTSQTVFTYEKLLKNGKNNVDLARSHYFDENAIISINYTSGTTGLPKGVMYSHRSAYLNALGECLETKLSHMSNYLWILPMFHCNGWCYTWAVTAMGATHICVDDFNPDNIIKLILTYNITHFCAAPTVLIELAQSTNFYLLKRIEQLTIVTAGATPSPTLIRTYEENNMVERYLNHGIIKFKSLSRSGGYSFNFYAGC